MVPESLLSEHFCSHFECHGNSFVACFDVEVGFGVVDSVEILHPPWQFVHIIGTCDEMSSFSIPPVCGISTMSCRQYGRPVFEGDAEDFRLEVGGDFQLVAYGVGEHVSW